MIVSHDVKSIGLTSEFGTYDAITNQYFHTLNREEQILLLMECKRALTPDGLIFLRVPKNKLPVREMIAMLGDHPDPLFTVAETYDVGDSRDYLLRSLDSKPTICIGMIAKNEERDLPKCLTSLEGVAHGICMIDTGSTDKTMQLASEWAAAQGFESDLTEKRIHVDQYTGASEKDEKGDWKLWNFSKARNQYVKHIEKMDFDYVLWMDADDILMNKEIKNLVYLDQFVIHGVTIHSGSLKWPHHRLWKTKKGITYAGGCHEYPNWGWQAATVHDHVEIFHDAAPGGHENSNDRNLRILEREMKKEPTPRTAFYLANTYKDRGNHEKAIPAYKKRMEFGKGYEDEYWFAALYKARGERALKRFDEARKTLMHAINERPDWAEFWMELAFLENDRGRFYPAIGWCLQAKDLAPPPTSLWREKDKYTDQPCRTISWAYSYLSDWDQALTWALRAKEKIGGPDKDWDTRIDFLRQQSGRSEKTVAPTKRRVLWHRPGAIGDVMMTLNMVETYKKKNPDDYIIYKCAPQIAGMLAPLMAEVGIDRVITTAENEPHDLSYNLIGYPINDGHPFKPMKKHLLQFFSDELGLDGLYSDLKLALPARKIKPQYMTLHVKSGWSMYKNWDFKNWEVVVAELKKRGIRVVQIGGKDEPAIAGADNRTGIPFMESLALLANAKVHAGIDSWTNHATNIDWKGKGKVPGVILWGSSQHSSLGYPQNKNISLDLPCQPCWREDPKISSIPQGVCPNPGEQTYEEPRHACMAGISPERVLQAILEAWGPLQPSSQTTPTAQE